MNRQAGITLVEVAISVAIVGILMGGALEIEQQARAQRQLQTTYDNMDAITQALSIYVETAGRLPCPADPEVSDVSFGWERGVKPLDLQSSHSPIGTCDAKTREGLVPFMTIGIPVQTARDGWGNFYTYAVSPVFTRKNDQTPAVADTGKVHGRCRHPGWVNTFDRYNRNAIKARFCCADQAKPVFDVDSDLIILHTNGGAALSPVRTPGTMNNYDDLTKTTASLRNDAHVPYMDTTPIEAPALVMISHGKNGKGAWLGNGTNNRLSPPDSGLELQNADGDQIFVDGPWNLKPGPAYFDDIVRWMTQDGIMAAHGALSCSYP